METTLILLKPDAVQRGLVGEIVSRFEKKGLQIVGIKMVILSREMAEQHYAEHRSRSDFNALIDFMTSGPVVVLALKGKHAVATCRKMIGGTIGTNADPGTIRGDYGMSRLLNLVHGADSPESARRELQAFFVESELLPFEPALATWTYASIDLDTEGVRLPNQEFHATRRSR